MINEAGWQRCDNSMFYWPGKGFDLSTFFIDPINMQLVSSAQNREGGKQVEVTRDLLPINEGILRGLPKEEDAQIVVQWLNHVLKGLRGSGLGFDQLVESFKDRTGSAWWQSILADLDVDPESRNKLLGIISNMIMANKKLAQRETVMVGATRKAVEKAFEGFGVPPCIQ